MNENAITVTQAIGLLSGNTVIHLKPNVDSPVSAIWSLEKNSHAFGIKWHDGTQDQRTTLEGTEYLYIRGT